MQLNLRGMQRLQKSEGVVFFGSTECFTEKYMEKKVNNSLTRSEQEANNSSIQTLTTDVLFQTVSVREVSSCPRETRTGFPISVEVVFWAGSK